MAKTLTQRIQDLKDKQAQATQNMSRLEGRREQLMSQLSEQFGVDSVDAAEELLETKKKDLDRRQARAERLVSDLEEQVANG